MADSITPPPELVKQWEINATLNRRAASLWTTAFATQAAQWGADQELEACCEWLCEDSMTKNSNRLRNARRPKPPSLKEQALEQLACIQTDLNKFGMGISTNTIRRALEALPDNTSLPS
jgi:hypothetical protein